MRERMLLVCLLATAGCLEPGAAATSPAVLQAPAAPPALFAAAVEHLAGEAEGRLLVDPRPLRPGADLAGVEADDLASEAAGIAQRQANVLTARGWGQTDAVADFRCTFTGGVGPPPSRLASLPDSIVRRQRECDAREPYTTLIFGLPRPVADERFGPGTWQLEAVAMTTGGFRIWDLYLRPDADGRWRVSRADARFTIWS